jgi:DNA-binding NarL/FixJ family response regulator
MLSEREREILSLVCLTNKQIARKIGLSWQTVQKVFANMKEKYGVKTRTKLLIEAIRAGEIQIVDCGFWNPYGQYIEDKQKIDLRKE